MKVKHLFFLSIGCMLAAACSEVNEEFEANNSKVLTTIYSGNSTFATRSVMDSKWEANDEIGVFMLYNDGTQINAAMENIGFTTGKLAEPSTTGVAFNAVGNGLPLLSEGEVQFVSYYPWNANGDKLGENYQYNIDLSGQSAEVTSLAAYDLRWAKTQSPINLSSWNKSLSLGFTHQLALLKVQVQTLSTVKSVFVSGLNTSAKFNLVDGTLSDAQNEGRMQLAKTNDNEYTVLVLPIESLSGLTLDFVVEENGGEIEYQYNYTPGNITKFEKNCRYKFAISLGGTSDVLGSLTADMNPWGEEELNVSGNADKHESLIPGYSEIKVASDANIADLIAGKSGNIALHFDDNSASVYTVNDVAVPEGVTGLTLISTKTGNNLVKLNIDRISSNAETSSLTNLTFMNLEVVGNSEKALIDNFNLLAANGTFNIENSHFHGMKNIYCGTLTNKDTDDTNNYNIISVVIKNSSIGDAGSDWFYANIDKVTCLESTLYNVSTAAHKKSGNMSIDVQSSTIYSAKYDGNTIFNAEKSTNNNGLIFMNNIVACFTSNSKTCNLTYRITNNASDLTGKIGNNFAAMGDDDTHGAKVMFSNNKIAAAWLTGSVVCKDADGNEVTAANKDFASQEGTKAVDIFATDSESGSYINANGFLKLKSTFQYCNQVGDPRGRTTYATDAVE